MVIIGWQCANVFAIRDRFDGVITVVIDRESANPFQADPNVAEAFTLAVCVITEPVIMLRLFALKK